MAQRLPLATMLASAFNDGLAVDAASGVGQGGAAASRYRFAAVHALGCSYGHRLMLLGGHMVSDRLCGHALGVRLCRVYVVSHFSALCIQ
ncbi:signal transduction histidine kinase [Zymobacter palmae]|uniref:Signal transduction histidine kinase n=1 Tax=Zymobacter palmae TaxID=33074 RepID=A0A348HI99_9GAMM|nr:signal transduction histidine kinase [Zymobacter palmae]